jgi:hypothetical protein
MRIIASIHVDCCGVDAATFISSADKLRKKNSDRTCCNCELKERERSRPANYRGCRLAKAELQRKRNLKIEKALLSYIRSSAARRQATAGTTNKSGAKGGGSASDTPTSKSGSLPRFLT